MSAPTVEQLLAERVDGRHRGFGAVADGLTVGELGAQGYDLRRGDLPLPLLALRQSALEHNLRVMHGWCAEHWLSLAPHGKTAMAPQLVRRQLDAGEHEPRRRCDRVDDGERLLVRPAPGARAADLDEDR